MISFRDCSVKFSEPESVLSMSNWSDNPAWLLIIAIIAVAVVCWFNLPGNDTRLMLAVLHNDTIEIQAIVSKRVDVNHRRKSDGESVSLLIRLGADKTLKDVSGKTVIDYALERGQTNVEGAWGTIAVDRTNLLGTVVV
jgi:hypothetical protein